MIPRGAYGTLEVLNIGLCMGFALKRAILAYFSSIFAYNRVYTEKTVKSRFLEDPLWDILFFFFGEKLYYGRYHIKFCASKKDIFSLTFQFWWNFWRPHFTQCHCKMFAMYNFSLRWWKIGQPIAQCWETQEFRTHPWKGCTVCKDIGRNTFSAPQCKKL